MYTEPKIITSNDLKTRSYITFYFNGERVREFNGRRLDKKINPNYASSLEDRNNLLNELLFELKKALKNNVYPVIKKVETQVKTISTESALLEALNKKLNSDLNKYYKRNLKSIHKDFINYLTPQEKQDEITAISIPSIEKFLSRYNSSGTYYMNKRRDLGVLFTSAGKIIQKQLVVVKETETRKSKAKLHKIYEKRQLKPILAYLKATHPNLYICCLISFGCFLRPHQEIRILCGHHFKNNLTEIHLSGDENKAGKIRVVYIPDYVKKELEEIIPQLKYETNLFSLNQEPFNSAYFNTAWTRAWTKMFKLGLVQREQTIYSFRHTAAVDVFKRTKDVYLLQKLLGHSTIVVTLRYLRGLGEYNAEELKNAAPQL